MAQTQSEHASGRGLRDHVGLLSQRRWTAMLVSLAVTGGVVVDARRLLRERPIVPPEVIPS